MQFVIHTSIPNCHYYSKFYVYPPTGTAYIGESFNNNPGTRVIKINNDGTLAITSPAASGTRTTELWAMHYQATTGQVIGFGGGGQVNNNLQIFPDTNLTSSMIYNFNSEARMSNDIASVAVDDNGDFYALISSQLANSKNHIQKSVFSNPYTPNIAWDVNSGYDYWELANYVTGARANTLAVNTHYLFSYDGKTLKAWDKSTGAELGSMVVSSSYSGGRYRGMNATDGVAVDECNNVYVGGLGKVHTYTFNGSVFTAGTPITKDIISNVFDVSINKKNNTLLVAGPYYVTVAELASSGTLTVQDSVNSCLGYASVTPTGGTPPYTYLWSNGDTTNSISGMSSGTYTVKISDNSCSVSTITDTVTITGNLIVNIGNDTSICGSSLKLDAKVPSASYKWSTGATTQTITATTSGMYWVEVTSGTCKNRDTISVTFASPISINLGNDTSICGSSLKLDAGISSATYLWSTGATTQTIKATTTGKYWLEVTSGTCKNSDTINVTFLSASPVNLGNDIITCEASLKLDAGVPSATYKWSTGATTQAVTVTVSGTYWVEVASGTCKSRDTINVTFLSATPIHLGNDTAICGTSLQLDAGIPSAVYLWSTGATTQTIAAVATGTYWVEVTSGPCKSRDTISVTLLSAGSVDLGNDTTLCGTSLKLNAGIPSATYLWSTGASTQSITADTSGTYWVELTLGTCKSSDTININIISPPSVTIEDTSICKGVSVTLNPVINGAYTSCLWTPPTGLSNDTIINPVATPESTTTYTIKVSNELCFAYDTVTVSVNAPIAAFTADPMDGTEPLPVTFTNKSIGAVKYEWNFGEASISTLYSPTHIYTTSGTYNVVLTVENSLGCKNIAKGIITVNSESILWIPNAFTPGGGDINEMFSVKSVGITDLEVMIFDRWGELIYEWTGINGGWDGTYKGNLAQDGVYVYIVKATGIDNKLYQRVGHVTLLKN